MSLRKRGKYWYGDEQLDIRGELRRYSGLNGYPAEHFAEVECACAARVFTLALDEDAGVAVRTCVDCAKSVTMCDGEDYLEDAELEERSCVCGRDQFELTVGVSLYEDSQDVRWIYVGARCPACGLTGCYGDWKNEYPDFQALLSRA